MNRFLRDNPYYPISEDDIEKFAESAIHAGHPGLEYHVTKDKSLIRTQFAKNMMACLQASQDVLQVNT